MQSMSALRVIFMGTPELACRSLQTLLAEPDFEVLAVATQPDRPKGRDLKLQPSPVKELALRSRLPVLQPERAREDAFIAELRGFAPDIILVAAYGQILPRSILDLPRFGCLNVHTSLLPRHRGAAPIQRSILEDDPETGISIMKMDVGLDTGPVLSQVKTPILPTDTAETLHDRLAEMGGQLLVRTVNDYVLGRLDPAPQPAEGVTYAAKIRKEDGLIDWSPPARKIWNQVRGLVPWPAAFTFLPSGTKRLLLKLWEAEVVEKTGPPGEILQAEAEGIVVGCGEQALRVLSLQREGGRRINAAQFLAGHPLARGQRLG